ncbi:diphthine--ammonia ligase [Rhizobacter sp. AJA081-3]|uniref:Dph6-related ATP pyrophosphatase n=1 Tax=Rhizobacter sp. AJA081-3 TaxID=2753607 RepID=UPI001AE0D306|nr:diphthine--ammonia ligase [Rhizobacter sp. AJA081-3]QTN23907.1 diphthine--ammonia ligase [Rhizobacter sp. AJA081-3]
MSAFFSWSGGKDSMLALHRALAAGVRVEVLLAMFDEGGERSRSHAIPPHLMRAQADALGIELVIGLAGWADYEAVFTARLREFAARGITHGLFGDIDLQPHRDWEEKVCAAAGLRAELPLWQEPRRALVDELLALGYRARVVCVDARFLDASFCGREFDAAFLADLPEGVDACGENGEFHTFVFDGPRFARPVAHELVAVHEIRQCAPALGHHFVAELR